MFSLRRISVTLLFLIPVLHTSYAVTPYGFRGAAEHGTGLSCICPSSFWSSFSNQALLAGNKSFSAGFSYESRFFIPELANRSAGMIIRTGGSSVGCMFSSFGYTGFRREEGAIATGLPLSKDVSAGIQLDYFSEKIPGEDYKRQYVTFEGGAIFNVTSKVRAGFHLFNPVPNSLRKSDLPSVIVAGAGIDLSTALFAGAEFEKCSGRRMLVRCGFEYEAAKKFRLRGGFSSENNSFSFGFGYNMKSVMVDIGFSTHERLGVSSAISIAYKIN